MSTTDAARTGAIDERSEHRRNGRTQFAPPAIAGGPAVQC